MKPILLGHSMLPRICLHSSTPKKADSCSSSSTWPFRAFDFADFCKVSASFKSSERASATLAKKKMLTVLQFRDGLFKVHLLAPVNRQGSRMDSLTCLSRLPIRVRGPTSTYA